MRLKLLFAALLMLLPVPALADVTAHYAMSEKDHIVIEADDHGNLRASFSAKFAIIRRDGIDYVVLIAPDGTPKVAEMAGVVGALADQMKGKMPVSDGKMLFAMKQGGTDRFAGFAGTIWVFTALPDEKGRPVDAPFEALVTTDPVLAPVGGFFQRFTQSITPMLAMVFGGETNLGQLGAELFAKGTPLRIGKTLTLESVDRAAIPPARFVLPGPVITPVEFVQFAMAPDRPRTVTVEVPQR